MMKIKKREEKKRVEDNLKCKSRSAMMIKQKSKIGFLSVIYE